MSKLFVYTYKKIINIPGTDFWVGLEGGGGGGGGGLGFFVVGGGNGTDGTGYLYGPSVIKIKNNIIDNFVILLVKNV